MCKTNDMINRKYKLLTADLSQVICGRSLIDEFASSPASAACSDGDKEVQAVVTDKKLRSDAYATHTDLHNRRDSVITTKDVSTLDELNASSTTDDSAADSIDPAGCQRRSARTTLPNQDNRRLDISDTSSERERTLSRSGGKLRKRSKPLHKCPTMNQALSSIMKPSRYSSACTIGLDSKATKPSYSGCTTSSSMSSSSSPSSSHTSAKQWIASGVVFSSSVEVYLFRIDL